MAGKTRPSLREKTLRNIALSNLSLTDKKCIEEVFKKFEELSQADVAEVKHGEWIEDIKEICPFNGIVPMKALVGYRCSVCNRPEFRKEPYCNCGAKMDGESVR